MVCACAYGQIVAKDEKYYNKTTMLYDHLEAADREIHGLRDRLREKKQVLQITQQRLQQEVRYLT